MTKSMMQRLHDSEINSSISSFYDGCWDWKLGDYMNGWKAEGQERSFEKAEEALAQAALEHFPQSTFALNQRPLKREDVKAGRWYRHRKTGNVYRVVSTNGRLEDTWEEAILYTTAYSDDSTIIARATVEFCDGRFEAMPEDFGK